MKLLSCIRDCCVTFNVYLEKDGDFNFTSLVGGDRKKLLSKLPEKLPNCQPSAFCNTVKEIWEVSKNMACTIAYAYTISIQ